MKKIFLIATLLLTAVITIFTTQTVTAEETFLYNAVVKSPIAGVHEKANAKTPLHTQALYNEEVKVLEISGEFVYAQVPDGYKGWIKSSDLTKDLTSVTPKDFKVVLNSKATKIYDANGAEIVTVPMGTILFGIEENEKYKVTLPDNITGYIDRFDGYLLLQDEELSLGTGKTFVITAQKLMGTKYLWGGCSEKGIDCSGLTYIAAKMNGVTLPRDSRPQSLEGTPVTLKNAKIGDQMFFSSTYRKDKIDHTGIYMGDGYFIHSSGGSGVRINHISDGNYSKILMSMSRIFEN